MFARGVASALRVRAGDCECSVRGVGSRHRFTSACVGREGARARDGVPARAAIEGQPAFVEPSLRRSGRSCRSPDCRTHTTFRVLSAAGRGTGRSVTAAAGHHTGFRVLRRELLSRDHAETAKDVRKQQFRACLVTTPDVKRSRGPCPEVDALVRPSHTDFRMLRPIECVLTPEPAGVEYESYINDYAGDPARSLSPFETSESARLSGSLLLLLARIDIDILYANAGHRSSAPSPRTRSTRKPV